MVRFLDLDALNQPGGEVQINSKTYAVWPIKVKTVVNLSLPATATGNGAEPSFAEQLQTTVGILRQLIPDVPVDELEGLSLDQLNALLTWAREVAYGVAEKNSEEPAPASPMPEGAPAPGTPPSTSPA